MATYPQWLPGQEPDIVGAAIAHLEAAVPEATFRPGSPEVTTTEAWAVVLGDVIQRYLDAPAAAARHWVGLLGEAPTDGVPSFGKARFHFTTTTSTVTVPAGTVLRYADTGGEPLEFVTTQELTRITSESIVGEVEIRATSNGTNHNGLPVGTLLSTEAYLLPVERVEISEETRAGEDPEADAAFDIRARAAMARLNKTLVHPSQVQAAVLSRAGVGRAFVLDRYDADTSTPNSVGHVTVAATDTEGLPLPTDVREELEQWVAGQMLASLVVHVVDPTYTDLTLEVSVVAAAGWDYFDVENGVRTALETFLDPMSWSWWDTITAYDLVAAIDDVPGVARVTTVPGPIALSGVAPLPRLGEVVVNVTGGGL